MSDMILGTKEAMILQFLNLIMEIDDSAIISYKYEDKAAMLLRNPSIQEQLLSKEAIITQDDILKAIKSMEYLVVPRQLLSNNAKQIIDNSEDMLRQYLDANANFKKAYYKFLDVVKEMKQQGR